MDFLYHILRIFLLVCFLLLTAEKCMAIEQPALTFNGLEAFYQKKILANNDLDALLDSDDRQFNLIKIEQQIKDLLFAYGFFDALVTLSYNQKTDIYIAQIDTGENYHIASVSVDEPPSVFTPRYLLKIRQGDVFDGFKLIKAENRILDFLGTQECRYIKRVKHSITLDEEAKTVHIIFDVGASPPSVFGKSTFTGTKTVENTVLNPLLNYETGDCYNEKKINDTIKNAINTNLFNTIYYNIDPQKKDETGTAHVDVMYQIDERKHRTYNYGIGFSDTEAVILSAGNEWRNLFQQGVSLNVQTRVSDRAQTLNFNSKYPSYFGFKQNLNSAITFGRERFETYNSDSLSTFLGYEKIPENKKHFSYGIGVRNNFSKVTQSAVLSEDYFISAVPVFTLYDDKDDFLRPTLGSTLRFDSVPAVNLLSVKDNFLKNQVTASHFINVSSVGNPIENSPTILAFRSTVGSIAGSTLDNIPITERFYAGGGGSVRGYDYQNLGDLKLGLPRGGASLFEGSFETRIGIGKTYGITFFIDGGNVYSDILPQVSQGLQFATGIGGRYYSDVIPIRLDIGVPLNPRHERNDSFGFYLGIGESF